MGRSRRFFIRPLPIPKEGAGVPLSIIHSFMILFSTFSFTISGCALRIPVHKG